MKLSNKGIDRLYAQVWMNQEDLPQDKIFEFETLEFQSDDFEDCVVLTVREAETIEHIIAIFQHYYNIFDGEMKVWQDLRKRIEEAEGK